MHVRHLWPLGLALGSGLAVPALGWTAVTAGLAGSSAVLGVRPETRPSTLWSAGAAAAASLAASAAFLRTGAPEPVPALGYAEMAALTALVFGLARRAPLRSAVALTAATCAAVAALVLRLIEASTDVPPVTAAIACAIFLTGPAVAAASGTYLRLLDARRRRAVTDARRDQRLALAQDLHDFVAHDVSAIVAQAQAGQVVAAGDPARAAALFAAVEQAGLRALASMDRAVDALHPDRRLAPMPGLAELPELAAGYSAAGAQVHLALDPGLAVPREVGAVAYRVVVEALTNVRRHASATRVDVRVRRVRDDVLVSVTNDGTRRRVPFARATGGGLGLQGLTERVRALGGTLTAGPHEQGWRVQATLPDRGADA
ncbi:sensor histidine kinase [Actinomadura litoris]|uniref:histidine kinase n=1 Tax=Actinomadura litoris TaxID=2678616 RepID=A0A7K1L358_9ACTN|nr:histidine kinase [Actinomadura litoris]MUN38705.1 two-component sensor histidine kinase [Actinomadura litoris]